MSTITQLQMNKLVNLYAQLGEDLPQVTEKFTKDMASAKITELEGKLKKLSVFYCSKDELVNLRNTLNNTLLFLMFKSEVLEVIPEHLTEALEQDQLVLDTLEQVNETGRNHVRFGDETKELLPLLSKARTRVEKRKKIIAVHEELKNKIQSAGDVLNALIDKDSYRKFMSNHAQEIKYWIENKASGEQIKLIRNLTIQATGSSENTDYIYSLTKNQASKMIDRLTFERGLSFRSEEIITKNMINRTIVDNGLKGAEKEVAVAFQQYEKPNEAYYQGENPNENPEETQWEKMIVSLSYNSGYMLECEYNDFTMLKEIVNMLVPQIGINRISDTIQNFLTLTKEQVEFLNLHFSDYRINKYNTEKEKALETLKGLMNLGLITKNEIASVME